jgi:hypothetical protein
VISLTTAQTNKAHSAKVQTVTLVRIETYTDYVGGTVEATYYAATLPLLYRWDGSNVNTFLGVVESVSPMLRGMSHIPDADQLDTRDGLRVNLDSGDRKDLNIWDELTSLNLIGATIEVATLLLDWDDGFIDESRWINQSTTTVDHIVRFRGEITQIPDWREDVTSFELVADASEPVLDWPRALNEAEVSEKDLGKLYPVPVGFARLVPCTQRQVGAVTTLVSAMTATTTGNINVTDADAFQPGGGFPLVFAVGSEFMEGSYVNAVTINVTLRGVTVGGQSSQAVEHIPGTVVIEIVQAGRFVWSGLPAVAVSNIYARSPQTGEIVLIPTTLLSYQPNMSILDTGRNLGVIGFTRGLWAQLIQFLNTETKISQQPTVSSGTLSETIRIPFSGHAVITNASNAAHTQNFGVTIGTGNMGFNGSSTAGNQDGAVFWQSGASLPAQDRTISRWRVVIGLSYRGDGSAATNIRYNFFSFAGGTPTNQALVSYVSTTRAYEVVAGAWQTPASTTGVISFTNSSGTPSQNGPRLQVFQNQTAGGQNVNAQFTVQPANTYIEVELVPQTASITQPTVATGGQELGFNVDLFADVFGVATIGTRVSNNAFDSASGWSTAGFGEGIGGATPPTAFETGVRFFASQDFIHREATRPIGPLDLRGQRIVFDVWVSSLSSISQRADAITLTVANGPNYYRYGLSWPTVVDAQQTWTEVSFTPEFAFNLIRATGGGVVDFSNIGGIGIGVGELAVSTRTNIAVRNLRLEPYNYNDSAMEAAEWLIEEQAGLEADSASFAQAAVNLGGTGFGGDLRNWGDNFANTLALIGRESRTNFVRSEGASGTVVKALNAEADLTFGGVVRTISEFADLRAVSRTLDERPTAFRCLYDFRNDRALTDIDAYRGLLQADIATNDISSVVATATISAQQTLVGKRQADDMAFFLLPNSGSAINVWAYYVSEALRGTSLRFTMRTSYRYGYDLEPGDIVDFSAPWDNSSIKARVTAVSFPFDSPSIELELEQVT